MSDYNWKINNTPNQDDIDYLCQQINVSESIAKILINRGIKKFDEAKDFFCPNLDNLHDPFLMKGMDQAVDFILKIIDKNENILVYGDYDTDGITSVAMMFLFFTENFKKNVFTYIPDRFKEGYGLSKNGIDFAHQNNCKLIITLDCGITAVDEVLYASEKKIDVIITDHHQPKDILPKAICILNPKQKDCQYPFKELSGCGVGFKLLQAIIQKRKLDPKIYHKYLDFVAVSISGDMVSVMGENRIILYHGLKKLSKNPNIGFIPFVEGINNKEIKTSDIVFNISPKINSSGRMDCPKKSLNILIEKDLDKARELIKEINETNQSRKVVDNEMRNEAVKMIENDNDDEKFTTVVFDENWHKGVLGIVASKLIEKYHRPTIVFCEVDENILSGSARTIYKIDILDLIEKSSEYVIKFGGHKAAAGLSIKKEDFFKFKEKFELETRKMYKKQDLERFIDVDLQINFEEINEKLVNNLERMEPFGPDNMTPIFVTNNMLKPKEVFFMGKEKEHIKFMLERYLAIGFWISQKYNNSRENINILYSLGRKEYDNQSEININIRDIK